VIVQIYGVLTPEDGVMVASLGAQHIGVVVGEQKSTPDEVDFATARAIFAALPPQTVKVALTISTDLAEIEKMVRAVQPDILHLSSDMDHPDPAAMQTLRRRLPGLPLMRAISVAGPESVEAALTFAQVSDYFLLDTKDPAETVIGATGKIHDWSISRQIVERVSLPVILAGGLSPDNVAEAVRVVKPWGVDSNTHTNYPGQQPIRKDPNRVRRFIHAATTALE